MLDHVHVENFKSLADVTIILDRFTVLVGANGCGKTTVLEGLHLLAQTGIAIAGERDATQRFSRLSGIYRGRRAPEWLIHRRRAGDLVLTARQCAGDELRVVAHVVALPGADRTITTGFEIEIGHDGLRCSIPPAVPSWWAAVYAVLDHERLRKFSGAELVRPTTTSTLGAITRDSNALAHITADLRELVPDIAELRVSRNELVLVYASGAEVPVDHAGDGTMMLLAVLAALRQHRRPRLLLLDDLGRGLHHTTQVALVQLLRRQLELDPELQIVCTTHSNSLLDLFELREVRVLALDAERRTHARPLAEHPELHKRGGGAQTGELWTALGEDWVTCADE